MIMDFLIIEIGKILSLNKDSKSSNKKKNLMELFIFKFFKIKSDYNLFLNKYLII